MGFWDKVKGWFGAKPTDASAAPAGAPGTLDQRIERLVVERMAARREFRALDLAEELSGPRVAVELSRTIAAALDVMWRDGRLGGYQRTWFGAPHELWVFHAPGAGAVAFLSAVAQTDQRPRGERTETASATPRPAAPSAPPPVRPPAPSAPPPSAAVPPPAPPANPFVSSRLLSLSADETRRRLMQGQARWGDVSQRSDLIPPASDERVALIDRALVLRGLISEDELAEAHRVGGEWLRFRDAKLNAELRGRVSADEAVEAQRRERRERKLQKQRAAAERRARRVEAIARRKAEDVIFLGVGVSSGLADRRSDVERLQARRLPVLSTPADVARALEIGVGPLRWLAYHSDAAARSHYVHFEVPKRSGGMRLLSAPQPHLARAQKWIFDQVLAPLDCEPPAHGFRRGRSTVTNAAPHLGRDVVVNLDLSDFFPTITFPRVRGLFTKLGYSPAVATVLALLCTAAPCRAVEYDGRKYWVAVGPRALPQGACTSPALSNQIARRLDKRLAGLAARHGWAYTRYADDLTFSAPAGKRGEVALLQARVRHIVGEEGFAVNPSKGRVQRAEGRQLVTGVVVNDKLGLPRDEVRRLRAILHNARRHGLASQNRDQLPHFEAWLRGKIAYLQMVDREKGAALMAELDALR